MLITQASDRGLIRGVYIAKTGEQYTHKQFANDTIVVVEAKREFIDTTFAIFQLMDRAFGIFIKSYGVKLLWYQANRCPRSSLT